MKLTIRSPAATAATAAVQDGHASATYLVMLCHKKKSKSKAITNANANADADADADADVNTNANANAIAKLTETLQR